MVSREDGLLNLAGCEFLLRRQPMPNRAWVFNLGINMNIELDEVVGQDASDDALELAAGGAQGGVDWGFSGRPFC